MNVINRKGNRAFDRHVAPDVPHREEHIVL